MHQLKGCGLPNVRLASGYVIDESDQSVAYADVQGLFKVLALTVACRGADLTAEEFRFLRKRLDKSQAEVARLVGTSDAQAVANWEKGRTPVPTAAGRLLRLSWLNAFARKHVNRSLEKMWSAREFICHGYVLAYTDGQWVDVSAEHELKTIKVEAERATWRVCQALMVSSNGSTYAGLTTAGSLRPNITWTANEQTAST